MQIAIIGAGGHAKVVIATLQAAGHTVVGLFDDLAPASKSVLGVPVLGPTADAARVGTPAVIAVGANEARHRISREIEGIEWAVAIHPSATVHSSAILGPGTVVFAGAVIQPDAILGDHVIVNTGASVDHDCRVGSYAHLAPGCRLAGSVTVGEGAILGIASFAIPGVSVGAWTVVGAGAGVLRDLPPRITAVGIPARIANRS